MVPLNAVGMCADVRHADGDVAFHAVQAGRVEGDLVAAAWRADGDTRGHAVDTARAACAQTEDEEKERELTH